MGLSGGGDSGGGVGVRCQLYVGETVASITWFQREIVHVCVCLCMRWWRWRFCYGDGCDGGGADSGVGGQTV